MATIMSIRPPDSLRNKLKQAAIDNGFTVNALVIHILWDWVKKNTPANERDMTHD